jgi:hypothetical protein
LLQLTDAWELNGAATGPTANACTGNLRPGRYALAKTPTGVDSHLLSVHLDSGRASRDYDHRRQAIQRIGQIRVGNTPILELDRDVLVLGDYNPMGRQDAPPVSAQEELVVFDGELAPGFRRLAMTPNCTEYFEGKGGTLDHVVVSTGMQEAAATVLTDLFGLHPFTDTLHQDHDLEPLLEPRSFGSFDEAAEEAAMSRLYAGIHYRFDNQNGLEQGRCIGKAIVDRVHFTKSGSGPR